MTKPEEGRLAQEPYGAPVTTVEELDTLDSDEMVEGYRDGRNNEPEPSGNRSKAYWHGWRNGMSDAGHAQIDGAQRELVRAFLKATPETPND